MDPVVKLVLAISLGSVNYIMAVTWALVVA